uniref:rRNA-processing protein FYV7 n=1 Tax=Rhodosorus marinus TaxID=101924 RepID=A0A7S3EDD7_9RHOD|mmetsp:Transcript_27259/g.106470  ORF Transcript_27259/g.106470 Transcript_27259/m.106470 type:complete len:182 (+) Transcript_27259:346-891(+)|eukprot:CAMPEP_0113963812 /NCGR_PEP_ID=MMETSP0011_2-20120614/6745_1 /TAXON_ID=101924 /ORGANISM="Rhodosorus marinus" /LENGTH=181 /DNA_ID=CAMNT_0000975951 /DNA_START=463 /DNA_END=1008 /DNA_ORIENTATION=- /assembly_acc=CAM_ASM_000156
MVKGERRNAGVSISKVLGRSGDDQRRRFAEKKQKLNKIEKNARFKRLRVHKKLLSELGDGTADNTHGSEAKEADDGGQLAKSALKAVQGRTLKRKQKKKSPFAKEVAEFQRIQEEKETERKKQVGEAEETRKRLKQAHKRRTESAKAYRKITGKGQPKLRFKVENLLDKLQKEKKRSDGGG